MFQLKSFCCFFLAVKYHTQFSLSKFSTPFLNSQEYKLLKTALSCHIEVVIYVLYTQPTIYAAKIASVQQNMHTVPTSSLQYKYSTCAYAGNVDVMLFYTAVKGTGAAWPAGAAQC